MKDTLQIKAIKYYLFSILTLLNHSNWWAGSKIIFGKTVLFKTDQGISYWVRRFMDIWTIKEVVIDDIYRINKLNISHKDVVVDIGAAIGDASLIAARKGARVIAYEPDKDRIELFKMNVSENRLQNIFLREEAARSLDEIFDKDHIRMCKLLKVDCEGGEYAIFRKASKNTLNLILNIAMEIHLFNEEMQKDYPELKNKLIKSGFKVTEQENQVHSYIKYLFAVR